MKTDLKRWELVRLFFAILTLSAVGIQLNTHISEGYNVTNFFSYFTNLSNIFASLVFIVGGLQTLRGRPTTKAHEFFRGTAVVCMLLVGLVFNTLLLNVDLGSLAPWINNIVHRVMPLVVLIDWYLHPSPFHIPPSRIGLWLIPPGLYLIYSIVRGSLVNWYPYPFFDPEKVGGAMGVGIYCTGMLIGLLGIAFFVMWLSNSQLKKDGSE